MLYTERGIAVAGQVVCQFVCNVGGLWSWNGEVISRINSVIFPLLGDPKIVRKFEGNCQILGRTRETKQKPCHSACNLSYLRHGARYDHHIDH